MARPRKEPKQPKRTQDLSSARAVANVTPEATAAYKRLFDPDQTSTQEFIEAFQIQTKRLHRKTRTAMTQFLLRKAQKRILDEVERQWAAGQGAKIVILKDRTQGCSSLIQGLMFERICRGGGGKGKTVSHKDEATQELLEILNSFKNQVPDWAWGTIGARLIRQNERGVQLQFGSHLTAGAQVLTCGDAAMGRGGANRWIHISEYPWWARGKDALGGLLETWDDVPGNLCIIESTANGMEQFHDIWQKAVKGSSAEREEWLPEHLIFVPMFFSWLSHPQKRIEFPSDHARNEFIQTIGKRGEYSVEDELVLYGEHQAEPEQLLWRRVTIDGPKCNGNILVFHREHPTTDMEAFTSTGRNVYPNNILKAWVKLGKQMDDNAKVGMIVNKDGERYFAPELRGPLAIYEDPKEGEAYCWGADPAEGRRVLADGKTEGDFSTIEVRHVRTRRIVALYEHHIYPVPFAAAIWNLARYYGMAKGYVERNNHGLMVLDALEELGGGEVILQERLLLPTDSGKVWTLRSGWAASSKSKPRAVDTSREWVRELGLPMERIHAGDDGKVVPVLPFRLIKQMMKYVYLRETTKMGAESGHDDIVSADYICHAACDIVEPDLPTLSVVPKQETAKDRYYKWRRQRAGAKRGEDELGSMYSDVG